jgi:3-oxoacyl-[acyl-carrier protein] reductase
MDLELTGKVALVTGASRGIGRAIAEGLAAEGTRLVIAARGAEALDEVRLALEATGAEVLAVPTDVGDDASVEALVKNARERFGQIDILISNASPLAVTGDRASWEASLNVDVMGAVRLVEAVLPTMRAERAGCILFVSRRSRGSRPGRCRITATPRRKPP